MSSHLKEEKGAAFWNKNKTKAAHPDFIGNCLIKGQEYTVGVWLSKTDAKGEVYVYLSFNEKILEIEPDIQTY